jgi:hypothetical protein
MQRERGPPVPAQVPEHATRSGVHPGSGSPRPIAKYRTPSRAISEGS